MVTDPKHGTAGALDELGARADTAELASGDEPVTADLFGHQASLPVLQLRDEKGHKVPVHRAGPGRPAGSRNRSTEQLIRLVTQKYGHPILRLAELAATPVPVLADTLNCSLMEAAEFHRKCQNDLAPYIAQKLPQMLQIDQPTAGVLNVFLGMPAGDGQHQSPDGLPIALQQQETKTIENQPVSDSEPEKSETESRKDTDK